VGNVGADRVLDFIVDYAPAPSEPTGIQGEAGAFEQWRRAEAARNRCRARIRFMFLRNGFRRLCRAQFPTSKFFPGVVKNDATMQNFSRGSQESWRHISIIQGKDGRFRWLSCTPAISVQWQS